MPSRHIMLGGFLSQSVKILHKQKFNENYIPGIWSDLREYTLEHSKGLPSAQPGASSGGGVVGSGYS